MKNTRAVAALAIQAVIDDKQSLSQALPRLAENLDESGKGQCQDFIYAVLRAFPKYNYFINQLSHTKLKPELNLIRYLIAVGMYQLDSKRVAEHAAIAETVEASRVLNKDGLSALVNALLRNYQREASALNQYLTANPNTIRQTLPDWLQKMLKDAYPKGVKKIAKASLQKPPMWLRINPRANTADEFCQQLSQAEIAFKQDPKQRECVQIDPPCNVDKLPGFFAGSSSVQDKAAQQAARLLELKDGQTILDACAAPGGKTAHILELSEVAKLDALDIDEQRLARTEKTLTRLKLKARLISGDASQTTWWDGTQYDRILLDAPCSATGVIRRHPDIMYLRRAEDIAQLVALQKQILHNLWAMLKPGGILLYATCSILPQENKQQISAFLQRQDNASLLPIFATESLQDPGWQILPGNQNMDGFYYARLIKASD
ncbi:16S rRNA (cytosine(967)-C(5))-methyltransferase RsmB [Gayadomonas joobiniege]|uniref:16S rRNA (cytosine(967)-C(5))-methyltransferase RsmB n=1 Tax=Gayadomonas joobiniege TaxID=1234606 RepID=UPI00037AF4A7|nr:16S rRNA (cytosine(967)-C(5))-methyltransferase RsmB [Gayadomonas joobiniege]